MSDNFQAYAIAGFATVSGFIMWRRAMKVGSLSASTATSKIATAAKGFVELTGIARPYGNIPLTDPATSQSCVWFHVILEEKHWTGKTTDWREVSTVTSNRPFVLEDGTGRCVVTCTETDVERDSPQVVNVQSNQRYKVWRLHSGDPLYALGYLVRANDDDPQPPMKDESRTVSASVMTDYDRKKKVTESMMGLLKLWKQDQRSLVARFDTDGNGRVDSQEWEKAQATARELAEKKLAADSIAAVNSPPQAAQQSPDTLNEKITHKLIRPTDGRPLLIAKGTEKTVTTHERWRSILGLLMFVGGAVGLVFLLTRR